LLITAASLMIEPLICFFPASQQDILRK
jgi:hypothetical protein